MDSTVKPYIFLGILKDNETQKVFDVNEDSLSHSLSEVQNKVTELTEIYPGRFCLIGYIEYNTLTHTIKDHKIFSNDMKYSIYINIYEAWGIDLCINISESFDDALTNLTDHLNEEIDSNYNLTSWNYTSGFVPNGNYLSTISLVSKYETIKVKSLDLKAEARDCINEMRAHKDEYQPFYI